MTHNTNEEGEDVMEGFDESIVIEKLREVVENNNELLDAEKVKELTRKSAEATTKIIQLLLSLIETDAKKALAIPVIFEILEVAKAGLFVQFYGQLIHGDDVISSSIDDTESDEDGDSLAN